VAIVAREDGIVAREEERGGSEGEIGEKNGRAQGE